LEDIDPAFLRPGRIDYILEFKKATVKIIREMVEYRFRSYGINMDGYQTYFENMRDYVLSPAEVQNICFKYSAENIEECLTEIMDKCKKSYML
jgi:SpoVK/Ycf46/Vps4 family AAA+-type ATPase